MSEITVETAQDTAAEVAVESVETAAKVALESVESEAKVALENAEIISEAEAAVVNLKYVKRNLRQIEELSDLEKAELADAMEEVLAQYSKIQPLYRSTKERLLAAAKVVGACLAVAAVLAGYFKFFL